jgi:cell volume regulation protein A
MAVDAAHALATAGVVLLASTAASALFRLTRIPDVLQLLVFGIAGGPLLHFLDKALFAAIAPVASVAAILVILFDGGLDIRLKDLRRGAGPSILLAVLAWGGTAVLSAGVAVWLLHMPVSLAILLGMCFGGAGVAIVIPLIRRMGVGRDAMTLVSLETAASDVLLVVGVFSLSSALAIPGSGPGAFAANLGLNFAVGLGIGALAGLGWAWALGRPWVAGQESIVTVGAVFLLYALTEALHGSGPLAVLAFALAVANRPGGSAFVAAEHPEGLPTAAPRSPEEHPSSFHRHAMLAIRAFVFVGLGATLNVSLLTPRVLLAALGITLAVIVARFWAIGFLARRRLPNGFDRAAVAAMFPCGLPTAAGALIPSTRFNLPGSEVLPQIAAVVILLTIVANGLVVAFLLQPGVRARLEGPAGAPNPFR